MELVYSMGHVIIHLLPNLPNLKILTKEMRRGVLIKGVVGTGLRGIAERYIVSVQQNLMAPSDEGASPGFAGGDGVELDGATGLFGYGPRKRGKGAHHERERERERERGRDEGREDGGFDDAEMKLDRVDRFVMVKSRIV
jgi:hypothetical protein